MKSMLSRRRTWPAMLVFLAANAALSGCAISATETDLQKAVKAHDLEAVRTLLAAGASLNHSFGEPAAPYELSLLNLSPSEPATVEILRLLITRMDQPAGGSTSGRAANDIFPSHRSKASTAQVATSAVEIAARQWSADAVKVLLEQSLDISSVGVNVGSILVPDGGVPQEEKGALWLEGADVLHQPSGRRR